MLTKLAGIEGAGLLEEKVRTKQTLTRINAQYEHS